MPTYVIILIVTAHLLLLAAGIYAIVAGCAELWDREVARRATKLAQAMADHPAGKGLKE